MDAILFTLQVHGLFQALEDENKIRADYSSGCDVVYTLEDLKIGAEGNLAELSPGRRVQLSLGEAGVSLFCYRAVLLDARKDFEPFAYHCAVFLVPKVCILYHKSLLFLCALLSFVCICR